MRTSVHETGIPALRRPGTPKAVSGAAPATTVLIQRTRRDSLNFFESFPPGPTVAAEKMWDRIGNMARAQPDYFSVTHVHQRLPNANREVIQHLNHPTRLPVITHLYKSLHWSDVSCV